MYEKIGDFQKVVMDGFVRNREVVYRYSDPNQVPIISKLEILNFGINYFRISATAPTQEHYEQLVLAVKAGGFTAYNIFDDTHKRVSLSNRSLANLSNFVLILKSAENRLIQIENDIAEILNLNLTHIHPMTVWLKTWDDHSTECQLKHGMQYEFSHPGKTPVISNVRLFAYQNGKYEITVEAPNNEQFGQLKLAILQGGFYCAVSYGQDSTDYRTITLTNDSPALASNFLQTLISTECKIVDIADEISATLNLDLTKIHAMPKWIKSTSSGFHCGDNFEEIQFAYAQSGEMPFVCEFTIRHSAGNFEIYTRSPTHEKYNQLRPLIKIAGFNASDEGTLLYLSSKRLAKIQEYLQVIVAVENQFTVILDEITAFIHSKQLEASHIAQLGLFAAKRAPAMPEEFECAITYELMNDPVFDPAHPEIKFERAAITRALNIKNLNPFTTTPLTVNDLVSDVPLKERIENHVRNKAIPASNLPI